MILNQRQFNISRSELRKLRERLAALEAPDQPLAFDRPRLQLVTSAAARQVSELQEELDEYEALRTGTVPVAPIGSLSEIPLAIIRARIARGWTQARLGQELGLAEQQVQRYERTNYRGASLDRLRTIADLLNVQISGTVGMSTPAKNMPVRREWRKPLLVMLINALTQRRDIEGRMEIHKLMLLLDQHLQRNVGWSAFRFEPYRFGAFDPGLDDEIDVLAHRGFLTKEFGDDIDHDAVLRSVVRETRLRANPLTHKWVEDFLASDVLAPPVEKLRVERVVGDVVERYGSMTRTELLELTYESLPEFSARSEIRDQVSESAARRRARTTRA